MDTLTKRFDQALLSRISLALIVLLSTGGWANCRAQDSIPSQNILRAQFGATFTGWDLELSLARQFGKHEIGLGGQYVFGGNISGKSGSYGFASFWNYTPLQKNKISAFLGPSLNVLWVDAAGFFSKNRYTETYLNIGLRHLLSSNLEVGYQVGYGLVHLSLQDRSSDTRSSEVRQASSIKGSVIYHL